MDRAPENGSEINVADFEAQMKYLHNHGYRTLSLEEFLTYYQEGAFPKKSVLLTFDDGYRSFYTRAYPVLTKYQFRAVIFPIVGLTPGLARRLVWSPHLSFHEIRLMDKESGLIDVGSHTFDLHHHRSSDGKPAVFPGPDEGPSEYVRRIRKDLRVSKDLLELETDHQITALAWPYGAFSDRARFIAQQLGYQMFFTTRPGIFTPDASFLDIPRFLIQYGSLEEFQRLMTSPGITLKE